MIGDGCEGIGAFGGKVKNGHFAQISDANRFFASGNALSTASKILLISNSTPNPMVH